MKNKLILVILALFFALGGCSNDDDDNDGGIDLSNSACSLIGLNNRTANNRIIDGTACSEEGSSVVRIRVLNDDGTQGLCSGTMITSDDVLTAAHCFFSSVIAARVEVDGELVNATNIISHPSISEDNSIPAVINDIAILQLERSVNRPTEALVGSRGAARSDVIGIFGYGLDQNGNAEVLRSGEMLVDRVSNDHVFAVFNGDGSNTCNGDSGGPAVLAFVDTNGNAARGIVGVLSSGLDTTCGVGDTSIFTNTQNDLLDWVLSNVPDARVN